MTAAMHSLRRAWREPFRWSAILLFTTAESKLATDSQRASAFQTLWRSASIPEHLFYGL